MHWIRTFAALAAALALALPADVVARKKGHHGKRGKHAGRARMHVVHRGPPRDLARLVAARPRLPDGSRIVVNVPRTLAAPRTSAPRAMPTAPAADAWVAQRRRDAVAGYLHAHAPLR